MVDDTSFAGVPRRRSRAGVIALVAVVAFALGVGAMIWASRHGWLNWSTAPAPAMASGPAAAPTPAALPDIGTLAGRETALAAQLAALEARAATLDTDTAAASGQAVRAEAVLVLSAARRALDRGLGLGYLGEQIQRRFGAVAPRETATVIQAARQPVTLEDLRESLAATGPNLLAGESDWWAGIGTELRQLVVIHRAGTPSPLPSDRLERAQRMIAAGNVEPAIAEVSRLPGAASADAWLTAARRYVAARAALDRLEAVAIAGQLASPAASTPSAAAPAPQAR